MLSCFYDRIDSLYEFDCFNASELGVAGVFCHKESECVGLQTARSGISFFGSSK